MDLAELGIAIMVGGVVVVIIIVALAAWALGHWVL
jgi:hypothetical protein